MNGGSERDCRALPRIAAILNYGMQHQLCQAACSKSSDRPAHRQRPPSRSPRQGRVRPQGTRPFFPLCAATLLRASALPPWCPPLLSFRSIGLMPHRRAQRVPVGHGWLRGVRRRGALSGDAAIWRLRRIMPSVMENSTKGPQVGAVKKMQINAQKREAMQARQITVVSRIMRAAAASDSHLSYRSRRHRGTCAPPTLRARSVVAEAKDRSADGADGGRGRAR